MTVGYSCLRFDRPFPIGYGPNLWFSLYLLYLKALSLQKQRRRRGSSADQSNVATVRKWWWLSDAHHTENVVTT